MSTTLPATASSASSADQVEYLINAMTLEEKIAQLYGVWVGASNDGGEVAPHQHDMEDAVDLDELLPQGLGQLTRPFGSAPVDAALGAVSLARTQQRILETSRFRIPAIAHDECLAGFAAWGATAYPVPLSWGATFDEPLIEKMAHRIGVDMASVGVHQGLAPVLDVVRDARWGRVEETIGEDPYLVGIIGTAYVRGLQSAGIVATLKHFVGYSASRAGRNLAPVSIGMRERADVLLPPFEMAIREGGARSVMHSYSDIDGVPSAADEQLLTVLLREKWGFSGTVVADYFGIAFLKMLHGVAGTWGEAASAALAAGVDVELPTVKTFGEPLVAAVTSGELSEDVIDQALRRVLTQKAELGLLDPDWSAVPPALIGIDTDDLESVRGTIDLDSAANRAVAREIAEKSVVLLRNEGTLPLASPRRIAVVGPTGNDPFSVLGCYSFPAHVGVQHPHVPVGIALPTLLESITVEFADSDVRYSLGTTIDGGDTDGIPDAVAAAAASDVVILALGDRAGLFGRGTSGEGCDVQDLSLPGSQQELLDSILATGTPVVVVLLAGRPYALGSAPEQASAIVQTFFPGEEGTAAIAGVLSGRVNPSGRLPVSVPANPGVQPATYLASPLAQANSVSNLDPTAAYPFGHGLSYTAIAWEIVDSAESTMDSNGSVTIGVRLRNTGSRDGAEIVQVYLHDPVASTVRPVQRLIGFARVELEAGQERELSFTIHADLTSFTGRAGDRIVEPGRIELGFARSSNEIVFTRSVDITGPTRVVDHTRTLRAAVAEKL